MSTIQVRPFRRSDKDQLTQLVNAHALAVVPGMSVSVNTVVSSLERQPGEFIVDPWVAERVTLVAEQQSRIAAAAHVHRYFPDERAGLAYRDAGEILWLLYWAETPAGNPCWPDAAPAARELISSCIAQFGDWGVTRSTRAVSCPSTASTGFPSSGRTSARSTGRPASPTRATPRSSTWPGSRTCPARPGSRLRGCRCAARSGSTAAACPPCSART
jgi:hypothetical protein